MKTLTNTLTVFLFVVMCLLCVSGYETDGSDRPFNWRDYMHFVSGRIISIASAPLWQGGTVLTMSLFGLAIALACRSRYLKSVPIRQSRHGPSGAQ